MALVSLNQVGDALQQKLVALGNPQKGETPETTQTREDLKRLIFVWEFVTSADGEMGGNPNAHQVLLDAINEILPLRSLDQVTKTLTRKLAAIEQNYQQVLAEWIPNVVGNVGPMDTPEQHRLLVDVINEAGNLPPINAMTVSELFARDFPDLADDIDNTGSFWPRVKDNTITNDELIFCIKVTEVGQDFDSKVYKASVHLMIYRLTGVIPNPG